MKTIVILLHFVKLAKKLKETFIEGGKSSYYVLLRGTFSFQSALEVTL